MSADVEAQREVAYARPTQAGSFGSVTAYDAFTRLLVLFAYYRFTDRQADAHARRLALEMLEPGSESAFIVRTFAENALMPVIGELQRDGFHVIYAHPAFRRRTEAASRLTTTRLAVSRIGLPFRSPGNQR